MVHYPITALISAGFCTCGNRELVFSTANVCLCMPRLWEPVRVCEGVWVCECVWGCLSVWVCERVWECVSVRVCKFVRVCVWVRVWVYEGVCQSGCVWVCESVRLCLSVAVWLSVWQRSLLVSICPLWWGSVDLSMNESANVSLGVSGHCVHLVFTFRFIRLLGNRGPPIGLSCIVKL